MQLPFKGIEPVTLGLLAPCSSQLSYPQVASVTVPDLLLLSLNLSLLAPTLETASAGLPFTFGFISGALCRFLGNSVQREHQECAGGRPEAVS